ncbi:MAG: hypothetical protein CME63_03410 [Halobacteriovoraceae bacterium]|nr:hypothetical protein [Halobacteriovoraceae bacterium]MBC96769.1 hypothetical protein [Halobacteriovoraceae bacterium]|tara:strand:- start:61750 stop:62577 length:828 start_codon:yes stop_codon:yes gene_type:complete
MKSIRYWVLSVLFIGFNIDGAANEFQMDDLSREDVDAISEEFSGNFVHSTVSGASSLGSVFGFEVGLVGRMTDAPRIKKIVQEQDPDNDFDSLYDAGLMAQVSIPFGITAEMIYLPEVDLSDLKANRTSFGVKWTMTDGVLALPFNLALRAHYSTSDLSYSDVINNSSTGGMDVNSVIGIKSKSMGANVTASFDLLVFEPFVGVGYVSSDTDINVNASGGSNIFTYTDSQSASSKSSGLHYFAGAQVNLLLFKIGAEYSNVYGVDRVAGKISFGF